MYRARFSMQRIIARPDGRTAVNVKPAVVPAHLPVRRTQTGHVFDDTIGQSMGFEQLEHLLAEQGDHVFGAGPVGRHKLSIPVKAAVRGDDVQMRIEILKVPECLHRHHAAGYGIFIRIIYE